MRGSRHSVVWVDSKSPTAHVNPSFSGTRSPPRPLLRRRSTIKLLYGPGIASPPWLSSQSVKILCTWVASAIYSLTLNLPELVPVRHGHPRPPAGPRPRRGAAASQIRPQSTGTRSGDLRPSEAYALPIQGYHLDLSTGACGAVLRSWFSLARNVCLKGLNTSRKSKRDLHSFAPLSRRCAGHGLLRGSRSLGLPPPHGWLSTPWVRLVRRCSLAALHKAARSRVAS